LGHEAIGDGDDAFSFGLQARQCQSQFRAGTLMAIKGGEVEVAVIVKGQEREGYRRLFFNDVANLGIFARNPSPSPQALPETGINPSQCVATM